MAKAQSGGAASAMLLMQDVGTVSSGIRWLPHGDWIGFAASDGIHLLSPNGKTAVSDPRGDIWLLAGFSAKRNPLQRLLGVFGY